MTSPRLGLSSSSGQECCHLTVAAADTRHGVASAADSALRQLGGMIDWNEPELVRRLYSLFLGTLVIKDKPATKPEHKRIPSNTRIRLKLMPVLLNSREAAVQFPSCIQVITGFVYSTHSTCVLAGHL